MSIFIQIKDKLQFRNEKKLLSTKPLVTQVTFTPRAFWQATK